MGLNYKEFREYEKRFERFRKGYPDFLRSFLAQYGQKFIDLVKSYTPVDTGKLINDWKLGDIEVSPRGVNCKIWYENSTYYASYVELGHAKPYKSGIAVEGGPDWVNGFFMVTISLEEIQWILPREYDRAFKKYMKSMGI